MKTRIYATPAVKMYVIAAHSNKKNIEKYI